MGRRKKTEPKLKQVKKEIEEIELKPVKTEDDWEVDLNIINNYINSFEGSSSYNKEIKKELENVEKGLEKELNITTNSDNLIELKPVKTENDWEVDLNIINNHINSFEGSSSYSREIRKELENVEKGLEKESDITTNSDNLNEKPEYFQEQILKKEEDIVVNLPLLNKKHFNYILNNYEIGKWFPDKMKKKYISNRYREIGLSRNVEIRHHHRGPVNALSIDTIENKYMLSVGIDSNILLYNLEDIQNENPNNTNSLYNNSKIIKPMATGNNDDKHKYSITNICWYPVDNGMFTTSSMDHSLKVWDTNTMRSIFKFKFDCPVFNHAFSPIAHSHTLIATGTKSSYVTLCDLRSGSQSHILIGHKNPVISLDWSPCNEYLLASGGGDHSIRLWDIRKPKSCLSSLCQYNSGGGKLNDVTAHNGTINGLKFLSNGSHIISFGCDCKIHLWNISDPVKMNTMLDYGDMLVNHTEKAIFPAINNVNECQPYLFQPSENNDILMYDVYSANYIKSLKGHFKGVNCVVIRNGFQELYSCGNDAEIIKWLPIEVKNANTDGQDEEEENNWSDNEDDLLF
ncbi:WD40 repeat-like protein [Piromyces finnis]|uniref:WD40 repeat-like protein n=1 Tax=Piromyces finnis TaxID=1754191 RepID=A0A1Y1V3Y3_9FUNG|nr:WD40 repeat-like protein [Piromyces finnis]|eukprot:ORX46676.1 WD40 repeat-like protein [Piromyces finnis]